MKDDLFWAFTTLVREHRLVSAICVGVFAFLFVYFVIPHVPIHQDQKTPVQPTTIIQQHSGDNSQCSNSAATQGSTIDCSVNPEEQHHAGSKSSAPESH
jgi:hypothetical protein